LDLMHFERDQLDRRIAAVRTTLTKRAEGKALMAAEMFDGFDHTQYEEEVTRRWGREAYQAGDSWWRSLSEEEKAAFQAEQQQIQDEYAEACRAQLDPGAEQVRAITARLHAWLRRPMGTVSQGYFLGLGDLYVADDRFAANFGGPEGAAYVRDAMHAYAEAAAPAPAPAVPRPRTLRSAIPSHSNAEFYGEIANFPAGLSIRTSRSRTTERSGASGVAGPAAPQASSSSRSRGTLPNPGRMPGFPW